MAENDFEKNVRREMDEFKVRPSDEVWTKIERKIRDSRRKRRIVFFLLFSLVALLVGGYGIYNYSRYSNANNGAQNNSAGITSSDDKKKINNAKMEARDKETMTSKSNIPHQKNSQQTNNKIVIARRKQGYTLSKPEKLPASIVDGKSVSSKPKRLNADTSAEKEDNNRDYVSRETRSVAPITEQADPGSKEIAQTGDQKPIVTDTMGAKLDQPKDNTTVPVVNKKKSHDVSQITWGVNFSAGASVITEDVFSFKSSYAAADRQYSAPGSSSGGYPVAGGVGGGNPGTYYVYSQSQNKAAFAFKTGINARKKISKRSSVSAGLGYAYLADKIMIGTNQAAAQSYSALYYSGSPKETHTDHFHFIELPLNYNLRVTNNEDRFLSINAGVAPSYLLSTNALIYDTTMGGIYYHQADLITKAHFNFISGISYQFNNKNNLEFSIGPQFSFDVTQVFKSDLDKRKYFLYTGIDARVFFNKKTK